MRAAIRGLLFDGQGVALDWRVSLRADADSLVRSLPLIARFTHVLHAGEDVVIDG